MADKTVYMKIRRQDGPNKPNYCGFRATGRMNVITALEITGGHGRQASGAGGLGALPRGLRRVLGADQRRRSSLQRLIERSAPR
jgi:hypothetical protein